MALYIATITIINLAVHRGLIIWAALAIATRWFTMRVGALNAFIAGRKGEYKSNGNDVKSFHLTEFKYQS